MAEVLEQTCEEYMLSPSTPKLIIFSLCVGEPTKYLQYVVTKADLLIMHGDDVFNMSPSELFKHVLWTTPHDLLTNLFLVSDYQRRTKVDKFSEKQFYRGVKELRVLSERSK